MKKDSLADFVKEASDSLLLVLSCHTKNCQGYKEFTLNGVMGDFCKHEIIMLTQRYGKSQIHPICEQKYNVYRNNYKINESKVIDKDYSISVRDD